MTKTTLATKTYINTKVGKALNDKAKVEAQQFEKKNADKFKKIDALFKEYRKIETKYIKEKQKIMDLTLNKNCEIIESGYGSLTKLVVRPKVKGERIWMGNTCLYEQSLLIISQVEMGEDLANIDKLIKEALK